MSNVPKSRRKESNFLASHEYYKLRKELTDLAKRKFGYSAHKFDEKIERYRETHANSNKLDEVVERFRQDQEAYDTWFIDYERNIVIDMIREIGKQFTYGNSIFPSRGPAGRDEFVERRMRIDSAIANCYILKNEIQYILETLPVDINKFERFSNMLDKQISLYKGVRQSDNRFVRWIREDVSSADYHRRRRADKEVPDTGLMLSPDQVKEIEDTPLDIPTYREAKSHQKKSDRQISPTKESSEAKSENQKEHRESTDSAKPEPAPYVQYRAPSVPNTAKMNIERFQKNIASQSSDLDAGTIQKVIPGQPLPRY